MEKLLVISSYPRIGTTHDSKVVGVATYTKNTLVSLFRASKQSLTITVLAEELPESEKIYNDEGITVKRIWKRKSIKSLFLLARALRAEKETKQVLIELELAMFGGMLHLLPLPFLLLYLKFLNKKVTVVFHQVVTTVSEVHGQINVPKHGPVPLILSLLLRLYYRILLRLTDRAIVFDEYLKDQLGKIGSIEKISVIPHGIETFENLPDKHVARRKLKLPKNQNIILYFGFLAWYKGTDLLVDAYSALPKKDRPLLVIAGGPNHNHTDKTFYQKYIKEITQKAKKEGFIVTGFVPEEHIPLYYAASDISILPYRTFMSSSGPLSFVFSAAKPFLLSHKLEPVFATADIRSIMKEQLLNPSDLTFTSKEELGEKIQGLLSDTARQKRIEGLGRKIQSLRSWDRIGKMYYETLFVSGAQPLKQSD